MPESWSTSGLDLLVAPEPGGGRRAGLERALRAAIRDGRLAAGARLPSTRALARDLGVARGTVSEAYSQLRAEGFLLARQGSGTVVAPQTAPLLDTAPVTLAAPDPRFDFHPGLPDLSAFPRARWAAATRRALRSVPDDAFGYCDPRGRIELRQALTVYLGRARGVVTSPDRILICSGWNQAVGLLSSVLAARGATRIAIENPSLPDQRTIVRQAGLDVLAVPVDDDGLCVEGLIGASADAVVVTPAHQCPIGGTLHPTRRAALLRWARETGGLIVEDDYDGEFRYGRQPVGALQGLDADRVVYAGTASKALGPGLRLAWLALPSWLVEPMTEAKRLADRHHGVVDQLALAELIEAGDFDRHIRRCRVEYRRRRDTLIAALAQRVPSTRPAGVAAGLSMLLWMPPDGPGECEIVARAAERSIRMMPLGMYWNEPVQRDPGLLIGFAAPPRHLFASAVHALVDVLAEIA
jgi:GntR family transcriptional regulator / MocR family aminotransferase